MDYKCVTTMEEINHYIGDAKVVAFDFETSPRDAYRSEEKAALDAHKAEIIGASFSVAEGSAIYVPIWHRSGVNCNPDEVMAFLAAFAADTELIKVAHNLSFEVMFLYAQGIMLQPPCYDTIAAAQLTLKNSTQFRVLSDSGLKTLVPALFDVDLPDFNTVTAGRHFDELNPQDPETIRYACADADYGQGNTVYFSECIIIFTSNLGIYTRNEMSVRAPNVTPDMEYSEVQEKVRQAIEDYFKLELGRPEILNRIGENIVVFDYIRPAVAKQILDAQVNKIIKNLAAEKGIELVITDKATSVLVTKALGNLANGGRGIGNIVESLLINPLARHMFDEEIKDKVRITINDIDAENMPYALFCNNEVI